MKWNLLKLTVMPFWVVISVLNIISGVLRGGWGAGVVAAAVAFVVFVTGGWFKYCSIQYNFPP